MLGTRNAAVDLPCAASGAGTQINTHRSKNEGARHHPACGRRNGPRRLIAVQPFTQLSPAGKHAPEQCLESISGVRFGANGNGDFQKKISTEGKPEAPGCGLATAKQARRVRLRQGFGATSERQKEWKNREAEVPVRRGRRRKRRRSDSPSLLFADFPMRAGAPRRCERATPGPR